MSQDKPFDFAYTRFLVNGMDEIRRDLDEGQFKEALDDIYWGMIPFLDQDIQKGLSKEETEIEAILYNVSQIRKTDRIQRVKAQLFREKLEARKLVRPILKKMMRKLHKAGYFLPARSMGIYDLTGGKKSGESDREGFPRRVPARI